MRPHQWVKNSFVLAPLVFAQKLADPDSVGRAALATVLFCIVSGSVYLMNDVADVAKDRAHPTKRKRPIPSGRLPIQLASRASNALAATAVGVGAVLGWDFSLATALYFAVNLAYSRKLKHVPYIDVLTIAFGFLVRIVAGALAIDVPLSIWIFACTFLLALYMGMGKRRHEILQAASNAEKQRKVLEAYHLGQLTMAMLATALATTAAYTAYSVDDHAQDFGTDLLWTTIPFCVIGLLRFFVLSARADTPDSPTEQITRDLPFLLNLGVWGVLILTLIYGR